MGMRRGENGQQMQQQLLHRNNNQGLRYMGNARNGLDASIVPQGQAGPMMPLTFDVSGNPIDAHRPVSISTLASALASAALEKRNEMLGDHLYPLVERLQPDHVAKVTGMLLEMDQTEVLHLI